MEMREGVSGRLDYPSVLAYLELLELRPDEKIDLLGKFRAIEEIVLKRREELSEKERKKQEREQERLSRKNGRTPHSTIRRKGRRNR